MSKRNWKYRTVWIATCVGVAMLSIGSGCGKHEVDLGQVSGSVTLDGKPVQGVFILFQPDGRKPSYSWIDAGGKFLLKYNAGNSGAVIGRQKVQLRIPAEDEVLDLPTGVTGPSSIPPKYLEPFQTVEVKSGKNEFNFDLTSEDRATAGG